MRRPVRYAHCFGILLILALAALAVPQALPPAMAAPEISLSPSEGDIGTSVDVEGTGFALVSSVQITFDGVPVESTVTVLGAFATSFDVPPSQAGEVVVTATDNAGNSASAGFTVANDAPVAQDVALSVDEDEAVEIALGASDANGDTLTFAIDKEPDHGTLQGFDSGSGTVTYVPEQDFSGDDSFDFSVNDGTDDDKATVSIAVASANDLPVAEPQSVSVDEGEEVEITLAGSDPEGDDLTFSITQEPEHGALSGAAPDLTYAPEQGYSGDDSFEFVVSDGEGSSEPAAVGITIVPVNSPPSAGDVQAETEEDESVTLYLSANDSDSEQVSFAIESAPSHGSLGQIRQTDPMSATVTYRPQDNYYGTDSFTYVADDGEAQSDIAVAEIEIEAVNDAPEVEGQSVTAEAGEPVEIMLTGTDVDGDELEFSIVGGAGRGTLSSVSSEDGESAVVTYTPDPDEHGQDSFTFRASDGDLQSNTATVIITISAPAAVPDAAPVQNEETAPQDAAPGDSSASAGGASPGNSAQEGAAADGETSEVPVPDVTPDDALQGAALQSLSTATDSGVGAFASSPMVWLIPGALVGVASVVAFLGYREKSLKGGLLAVYERLLGFMVLLGLAKAGAPGQNPGRSTGGLAYSVHMNRIYRILNDERGRAARKQIFDVQYGGVRADPKEYESSKSLAKKQFEQIGSILRFRPELQEPFFDSFGEITVKVWWAIKEDVDLDGRKGMRRESLEWLGGETEKYWARQSSGSKTS